MFNLKVVVWENGEKFIRIAFPADSLNGRTLYVSLDCYALTVDEHGECKLYPPTESGVLKLYGTAFNIPLIVRNNFKLHTHFYIRYSLN